MINKISPLFGPMPMPSITHRITSIRPAPTPTSLYQPEPRTHPPNNLHIQMYISHLLLFCLSHNIAQYHDETMAGSTKTKVSAKGSGATKKATKRKSKSVKPNFSTYIYRVLKQVRIFYLCVYLG